MRKLKYYLKIWWMLTRNAFSVVLGQRLALTFFLIGKILRFAFFVGFLFFLVSGAEGLSGYSSNQVILFFIVFVLVDSLSQFFFREVYRFRPKIVSGDFDLTLTKPVNALFISLLGGADLIDLITLPPLIWLTFYMAGLLNPTFLQSVIFIVMLVNGLLVAAAFHIAVLAMGIITLEVDHTVMIYRDLSSFGRFPVDIYKQPLSGVITYLLPVGIMMTFPAKSLMGLLSANTILLALFVGVLSLFLSLKFWNFALKKYSSASS